MKIYKYELTELPLLNKVGKRLLVTMPARPASRVVKLGKQGNNLVIWVEIDEGVRSYMEDMAFTLYPTEAEIYPRSTYIDTYFDGPYAWHLYQHY